MLTWDWPKNTLEPSENRTDEISDPEMKLFKERLVSFSCERTFGEFLRFLKTSLCTGCPKKVLPFDHS